MLKATTKDKPSYQFDRLSLGRQFISISLVTLGAISISSTAAAKYPWFEDKTPIKQEQLTFQPKLPPASNAHKRECSNQSTISYGDLTIDNTNQIDPNRCIQWIQRTHKADGNFILQAKDMAFHQVGFPYLAWVANNVVIEGKDNLDEAYFPRLTSVGGDIILDLKSAVEYVDMPRLETARSLQVSFRENNVDLNGLNSLSRLEELILTNNIPNNNILLNGLNNLSILTNYTIDGGNVLNPAANNNPADGGFLEHLRVVDGNLHIFANNMDTLYGLGNINTVRGNLVITTNRNNRANLLDLSGLEKIGQIDGELRIDSIDNLRSLRGLAQIRVNALSIFNNPLLENIAALDSLNILDNGRVTFEGNENLSCEQINLFTSRLNNSITVSTPDC